MGRLKKDETKWTEELIQDKLRLYFLSSSTKKYEVFGRFIYDWESDYLAITKSGYAYECEIKISRNDFFNDKKKVEKHLILEGKEDKQRPNYFYYAVPDGLIQPEEVPDDYGLLYIHQGYISVVKTAPLLHKEKVNINALNLIDKFYYGMWDYIDKYRKDNVKELKKEIKRLEKQVAEYDEMLSDANCQIIELEEQSTVYRNLSNF